MQATTVTKLVLQGSLFVLLSALTLDALAEDSNVPLDDRDSTYASAPPVFATNETIALNTLIPMDDRDSTYASGQGEEKAQHTGVQMNLRPPQPNQPKRWVCEYLNAADGDLYMFCNDLASLMNDDLVLEGDVQPSTAKYFPLWGKPKSDGKAIELAQILLCKPQAPCSVELASGRGGNTQVALF